MKFNQKIGLTYDDVLLVPKRSKVAHRSDVSTKTKLSRHLELNIPLVSANMDTVTESAMAIALAREGGLGIIHRFMSVEKQVEEVKKVKRHEGFILEKPFTLGPLATLAEALEKSKIHGMASFLIVDRQNRLLGILSRRDMLFQEKLDIPVRKLMTPFTKLITASLAISRLEAKKLMSAHKIEKLPLLDENKTIRGLITAKSLESFDKYPHSLKDLQGRLRVGAAVGAVSDFKERAGAVLAAGADIIIVDVAHGQNQVALEAVKMLRKKFKTAELIGGNVATPAGANDLLKLGVDAVKVGIGPGGLCTTRVVTGVGVPQFTAIVECAKICHKFKIPLIADGGTNYPGDLTKALAAGASSCMLAGWFAGTDEAPGEIILRNGHKFKIHRGSASFLAVADRKLAQSPEPQREKLNTVVPEGVEALIPYKGKVADVIYQLLGSLRSGMSYCNAKNLKELRGNAEFIRITEAGWRESKTHNIEEL